MAALEACLKAAHGILDTMLSFSIEIVKTLPMLIYFVRCTYAIVILIKMHVAVSTPNSELGKMMKPEDLRVEYYVDSLINLFSYVAKEEEFRPHPKVLRILSVLRDWFEKHKETVAAQQRGEQLPQPTTQPQQQDKGPYNQTPLHLLSQVATGNQPLQSTGVGGSEGQTSDWTFTSPNIINYGGKHPMTHPDQRLAVHQATEAGAYADAYAIPETDQGMIDPGNPEFGWGTNFEQAMDMALGGMDGLQGAGLDNWFLGDSMAPFAFNGDLTGVQQQQW
jgi:hypothetical protein